MGRIEFDSYLVVLRRATEKAVLVEFNGEEFWLPRACLSMRSEEIIDSTANGSEIEVQVMTFKARELGW